MRVALYWLSWFLMGASIVGIAMSLVLETWWEDVHAFDGTVSPAASLTIFAAGGCLIVAIVTMIFAKEPSR